MSYRVTPDGRGRIYEDERISFYHEDEIGNPLVTTQSRARTPEEFKAFAKDAWLSLGGEVEALGQWVLVRTEPARRSTDSGILLPNALEGFYGGLPKGRYAFAVVLSKGPDCCELQNVAESIMFPRQHFARWKVLVDGSLVGWIHESEIALIVTAH